MDVTDIVIDWLEEHGCDGLMSDDGCTCIGDSVVRCGDCSGCRPFRIVVYENDYGKVR